MAAGLGFGDNTKASIITRGLAETTRLAMALGADPRTMAGLAGVGAALQIRPSKAAIHDNLTLRPATLFGNLIDAV